MFRSSRLLLCILAATLLLAAVATASGTAPRAQAASGCGSIGYTVSNLRAQRVTCSGARRVARGWTHRDGCHPATDPGGPQSTRCGVGSYRCRAYVAYGQVSRVRCAKVGGRRVSFDYAP